MQLRLLQVAIALLFMLPIAARSESTMLETPFCSVHLGETWITESQPDPATYRLVAERYQTVATIAGQQWTKAPEDLNLAAIEYLNLRRSTEEQLMKKSGRTLIIQESLKRQEYGYQIELWGQDSEGRRFRYWAIVGSAKVVSIYMETYDQSELALEETFREFLRGFRA